MKKVILMAAAASALFIVSCNDEPKDDGKLTQAQADSIAQARIDSATAAQQRIADSVLAAQQALTADSLRIADSIKAATGKEPSPAAVNAARPNKNTKPSTNGKPQPTTPTTPTEPAKPEAPKAPSQGMRGNSDQDKKAGTSSGQGMRGNSDQSKKAGTSSGQGMRGNSDQNK